MSAVRAGQQAIGSQYDADHGREWKLRIPGVLEPEFGIHGRVASGERGTPQALPLARARAAVRSPARLAKVPGVLGINRYPCDRNGQSGGGGQARMWTPATRCQRRERRLRQIPSPCGTCGIGIHAVLIRSLGNCFTTPVRLLRTRTPTPTGPFHQFIDRGPRQRRATLRGKHERLSAYLRRTRHRARSSSPSRFGRSTCA
jgi:hypothetical protein